MTTNCDTEGRLLRWKLVGEIDQHRAQAIAQGLEQEVNVHLPQELELDLAGVTFMDSSGIAVVLRANRLMNELGGTLRLKRVPEQAMRVLRTAGLHRRLPIEELEQH